MIVTQSTEQTVATLAGLLESQAETVNRLAALVTRLIEAVADDDERLIRLEKTAGIEGWENEGGR